MILNLVIFFQGINHLFRKNYCLLKDLSLICKSKRNWIKILIQYTLIAIISFSYHPIGDCSIVLDFYLPVARKFSTWKINSICCYFSPIYITTVLLKPISFHHFIYNFITKHVISLLFQVTKKGWYIILTWFGLGSFSFVINLHISLIFRD